MENDVGRRSARGNIGRALLGGALVAAVVMALAGCGTGASGAKESALNAVGAGSSTQSASPTPQPTRTQTATPSAVAAPKVTHNIIEKTVEIPFGKSSTDDPGRPAGESAVVVAGVNGTSTETWDVALADGIETGRTKVSEKTTAEPVTEVTAVGSKQPEAPDPEPEAASDCDPNYEGACVPIDSDVDCAGGSGNGPSYVRGPVTVVGSDIYKLDGNGDGVGCE